MSEHPDGPRTLWTQVRDAMPLMAETVPRGLALEAGRHPTLTELRAALGLDLDIDGVSGAARSVRLPHDEPPSDDLLVEFIDALYRSLRSPRLVRLELTDQDIQAKREGEAIRLRAGEPLHLFVMVDNATESVAKFSADAGNGITSGTVEATRVASTLVDGGVASENQSEVVVAVKCEEHSTEVAVATSVTPAWTLRVDLVDDATAQATAGRVYLTDALGPAWPEGAIIRRDEHQNAFFHADGSFEVRVTGDVKIVATRGMEYEPVEVDVAAPNGDSANETVRLRRWSDMASEGWYGGDVHVHLHYGGEYLLDPPHASLVQRAEDVNFMNMMVANQGSAFVHDRQYFTGAPHELSDDTHILRWGEEYRNDFYGHLCMYGIAELVPPIYSGFRLSEHRHDLPANAAAADHCHSVGGTLSYAHPLFAPGDLDRVFSDAAPRRVEAKEAPVDIALGKVDALDVMSYPSVDLEVSELWYKLLNCGFRLPATAGTDTFMNFTGTGIFSNPPAGNRVFARVEGPFTTESWCAAIRAGRTFVTNGPMLTLSVSGEGPGAELQIEPGGKLAIAAEARSCQPMERLEVIVNGDIVATADATNNGRSARIETDIEIASDGFISVRALGPARRFVLGGPLFAHTSPVYVTAGVENPKRAACASYFDEWIERLITMCHEHGRYPGDSERDEVVALFREGQAFYKKLA
jgi:hypothetical protein